MGEGSWELGSGSQEHDDSNATLYFQVAFFSPDQPTADCREPTYSPRASPTSSPRTSPTHTPKTQPKDLTDIQPTDFTDIHPKELLTDIQP